MKFFLNTSNELRSNWWVAIFFLVLASITFPLIFLSRRQGWEITITHQAVIVVIATWISQLLRKKSMKELLGAINASLMKIIFRGFAAGALLMLIPALFLTVSGNISLQQGNGTFSSILNITFVFLSVAIAEEFLFRGFVFQQLRKGNGDWIAQLLIAGYFLLTHINNPGMSGNIKILASVNIFLASIMFGIAFIKTRSLVMPISFHFMANWMQGAVLGFGVSGNEQDSLLQPVFSNAPHWLTGGSFGLEASVPGLITVVAAIVILYKWKPSVYTQTKNRF